MKGFKNKKKKEKKRFRNARVRDYFGRSRCVKRSLYLDSGVDAGGPAQGGPLGAGQGSTSGNGPAGIAGQGEDLYTLEAEITELQRENALVESQVLRLRSDIATMENQLKHGDKVRYPAQPVHGLLLSATPAIGRLSSIDIIEFHPNTLFFFIFLFPSRIFCESTRPIAEKKDPLNLHA